MTTPLSRQARFQILAIAVLVSLTVGLFGRMAWIKNQAEAATRQALPETVAKLSQPHPAIGATGAWLKKTWTPLSHKVSLTLRFQDGALRSEMDLANMPACAVTLDYFKAHIDQAQKIHLLINQLPGQSLADLAPLSCVAAPGKPAASAAQVFTFGPISFAPTAPTLGLGNWTKK
jgi:hypothetical protein